MDKRNRVYYLVNLNQNYKKFWWNIGYDDFGEIHDRNLEILKSIISSLKVTENKMRYKDINNFYYEVKISCDIREENYLLILLNELKDVSYIKI